MDRIAREGTIAVNATVHAPLTRPSHVSIFTGLYPGQHGIRDNVSPPLGSEIPTLAEAFKHAGFSTAAFVSSIVLSRQSGLSRGFDTYSDRFESEADDIRFLNTIQKRGDVTLDEALTWIEAHAANRLFVWLHLYDPHDPYEPPEPYATRFADRPYDGEVAWSDELVGRLDAALARLGMRDRTLLALTSDHGEGLGEHGEDVHGFFVYETTLRVPLIMRGPGVTPGTRIESTIRSIDLFPTIAEVAALPVAADQRRTGRSFAAGLRGGAVEDQPSFGESLVPLLHYNWSDLRSIRDGRWKYILAPRPELYDLQTDPGERENLVRSRAALVQALHAALERHLKNEQGEARSAANAAAVPPDLLEKLGALGYVSAGGPAPGRASSGTDPKDKIEEYKVLNTIVREGLIALREGRHQVSVARFETLLARGVDSFEARYYLARALMNQRQWRRAAHNFEKAVERLPAYTAAYILLADCRLAMRDFAGAVEALQRGQKSTPDDRRLYEIEAGIWKRLGNRQEAARAYTALLERHPQDALARVQLGELYRDTGQVARGIALLREAVTIDPDRASYWNSLGMMLGGSGDLAASEEAFREAITRDAQNAQYAYNLGLALQRQGKFDAARPYFERALELDPKFIPARERLAAGR